MKQKWIKIICLSVSPIVVKGTLAVQIHAQSAAHESNTHTFVFYEWMNEWMNEWIKIYSQSDSFSEYSWGADYIHVQYNIIKLYNEWKMKCIADMNAIFEEESILVKIIICYFYSILCTCCWCYREICDCQQSCIIHL